MKKKILLAIAIWMCVSLGAQTVSPFKDGDRAVFLGNSITDGGHYHSYIWLYYMTRFPYAEVKVFNAGIGGNTAGDMYARLDGDVFAKKPTVLMVTFGMNDTGYSGYNGPNATEFGEQKYRECIANFKKMEKRLLGLKGVRIVMMGGTPYDETARLKNKVPLKGKNAVMDRIVAYQKAAAERNGWEFIDFSRPVGEIAAREQARDSSFTFSRGDRIHPDNDGHMVMAYLYLKAQGFAGKKVAGMEIDAASARVVSQENCTLSGLKKDRNSLSFDYLAYSLPYPLDSVPRGFASKHAQAGAIRLVPFMEEMNQELLKVTGLEEEYRLYIDDCYLGTWTAEEYASGINLATIVWTPQYQQALEVMYLNEWRWEMERMFRDYAWMQYQFMMPRGLLNAIDRKALEAIDRSKDGWAAARKDTYARLMHKNVREAKLAEMEMLIKKIYQLNKPQTRRIALKKVQDR